MEIIDQMNNQIQKTTTEKTTSTLDHMREKSQTTCHHLGESSYACSICRDTGLIFFRDEYGYLCQRDCECGLIERQRMASRLRFANIPEVYKDVKLDDLSVSVYKKPDSRVEMLNALMAIQVWLRNFDKMQESGVGLYLYSKIKGSGKTRAAAGIANEIMQKKNLPVKFATSMQIINEIKATWNGTGEYTNESKLLDALVTTNILIIDDFGTEQARDWISEKFYSIINGRYIDRKLTIFTSNMSLDTLKYDDRITNRIKEKTYVVRFPEESVRESIADYNRAWLENAIREEKMKHEA